MPDYSGGAWGGAAAGIQDATKTAMDAIGGIDQIKANQAVQDQAKTQQALSQFQLTQAKAKAERADKPMYEDDFQGFAKDHPATYALMQQASMPYMQSDPAGKKFIRTEDAQNVMKMFSSEKTLETKMGSAFYQDTVAQIENLKKQAAELQEKGDDKSKKALKGISDKMKTLDEQREQLRKQLTPKEEKGEVVPSGGAYIPPGQTQPSYTNPKEQGNQTQEQLTAKALKGDKEAKAILDDMERRARNKIQVGVDIRGAAKEKEQTKTDATLTPEALSQEAQKYRMTGQLPATGMSGKGKIAIINEAARQASAEGQTVEARVLSQSTIKAAQTELTTIQKQRGIVMSFANTAEKNLSLVDQLSSQVGRTGVPVVNRWLLAGKRSLAGDPEVAKFDAAVRTAINEYAKVTSSATGGSVTSDSARKEVESMLNSAQTPEQVTAVTKLLRQEMGNRKAGYNKQIEEVKGMLGGGTNSAKDPLGLR